MGPWVLPNPNILLPRAHGRGMGPRSWSLWGKGSQVVRCCQEGPSSPVTHSHLEAGLKDLCLQAEKLGPRVLKELNGSTGKQPVSRPQKAWSIPHKSVLSCDVEAVFT